jgi:hypothetical protein
LRMEKWKDYYFWPDKKEPFTNWVNDIEKFLWVWWEFEKQYQELCNSKILKEAAECFWWEIPNNWAKDYLINLDKWGDCHNLYKLKLNNYRATAYAILKDNKSQISHDEHKKFTQIQRWKFDELLDIMTANKWYLDDISSDVQSTTKYPN